MHQCLLTIFPALCLVQTSLFWIQMRLCCLLPSRPRPARNLLRLFVGLGINEDCLTLALSFGTFPLPPLSCLSSRFLPSLEKNRRDVSTLHFGNEVVSKKEAIVKKTRKNVLALGYANIEAQFTIIIQTDSQVPLKLITIIQPFKW